MNRNSQSQLRTTSPILRTVLAAAALGATLASGILIDTLSHGAGAPGMQNQQSAALAAAQRSHG